MATQIEEKSMIPTVLVGIGGTGAEVLSRVRRLVEETYGSLDNFPIISFLVVDTDKDYKITNPEAGGSAFKDYEKHWARVGGKQVQQMINNMDKYPWINSWFPTELERNLTSLEAGAGQIRACGRFAFFCNYHDLQSKFLDAVKRVKGRENLMQTEYGIKVSNDAVNVFITGSLSGGTGSGMLIDMGYCVRHWLRAEGSSLVNAIVPMPQAFAGISVGDRVLANGYAALMELNYYSDSRTEYLNEFSQGSVDQIKNQLPPFDFTYLVGTRNGENDFKLEQIREMIAQNIFLDMTSDFAPHKRSIRDNIKGSWAQADPGGRGYSKQFMSFGLSTIEIPIAHIRTSLSARLAQDIVKWWLNEDTSLPPQMLDLVRGDILKKMRLTELELLADLGAAENRTYLEEISQWINSIRDVIIKEKWLQCTQQGVNMIGSEKGKILTFVDTYLQPEIDAYRTGHFRELSPDERVHGDYFKKIYSNRDQIIQRGKKALTDELYRILEDRIRGPKFAEAFLIEVRKIFDDATEKFRREQDKVWSPNEVNRQRQYQAAIDEIKEFKDRFGISKQDRMEQYCNNALTGLEGSLIASIQRKTRAVGLEVIARLQEHINRLESRLNRWQQKLRQARDLFKQKADRDADSADALIINGIKLYERQELNLLYHNVIEQQSGGNEGKKTLYQLGMDVVCSTMSEDILKTTSPFWKETRAADEIMRLFDITELPDVRDEDFQGIILKRSRGVINKSLANSSLISELSACDRLFKIYKDDTELINNIRLAYQKSKPLIILNKAVLQGKDAGFTPATNRNVALLGGRNTGDAAAQKLIPKLKEFIPNDDDIKPLGEPERYRLVFVQEIGGFSLRCIDGMPELRQSYQDWKGQLIIAKRAQQRGESRDLPIPVHIKKEAPFWDLFPEDPEIIKLIVKARALGILRQEKNLKTKDNVIRYTYSTAIGLEDIDIAASWEETAQVLEVKECENDRQEINRQVLKKLHDAETDRQKLVLFKQFTNYLAQRVLDLKAGKDDPEYKREASIILEVIKAYNLDIDENLINSETTNLSNSSKDDSHDQILKNQPATALPVNNHIFCTNCGHKNPLNSKFCSKCGSKLI